MIQGVYFVISGVFFLNVRQKNLQLLILTGIKRISCDL